MIEKGSLRDQLTRYNIYDILVKWNRLIQDDELHADCLVDIILQTNTDGCPYNTPKCEKCIERLMNEIVPSQI